MPPPKASTPSTPPAGDDASKAAAQSPSDLVRVYNRSRRIFTHEVYKNDQAGREAAKYVAMPNTFVTIPRWLADIWVKGYPDELLPGDSALKAIDAGAAELAEATEKNRLLEQEKAALQAELAEARKQLAGQ